MLKSVLMAAAFAGIVFVIAPTAASAAPLATAPPLAGQSSDVENIHWRGWRHCHWRHGDRFCHGGRRWGRDFDGPGIYLNFGDRHGHRHHHHDGDRHHNRGHKMHH